VIAVTRLNSRPFVLNADLIETVEETPDTVITLQSGRKYIVLESVDEVVNRVVAYRSRARPARLVRDRPEPYDEPDPGR